MPLWLLALLMVALVGLLITAVFAARRDPRYTPSPLHRILDPIGVVVLGLIVVGIAVYVLVV